MIIAGKGRDYIISDFCQILSLSFLEINRFYSDFRGGQGERRGKIKEICLEHIPFDKGKGWKSCLHHNNPDDTEIHVGLIVALHRFFSGIVGYVRWGVPPGWDLNDRYLRMVIAWYGTVPLYAGAVQGILGDSYNTVIAACWGTVNELRIRPVLIPMIEEDLEMISKLLPKDLELPVPAMRVPRYGPICSQAYF